MDEHAKAGQPDEQAAKTTRQWELSHAHRRGDWPDPLREPYEPAQDELDLLYSQVPGHRWNGWRRLTGEEDYYAACSCGWRSTETGYVRPMLRQVMDHLDAVWAVRGQGRAPRTPQAPGRAEDEHDAGLHERVRELHAAVESQQRRLSQALERSTDLLSTSEEQADRLVAALQHAAAGVAPEWAKTEASVRRAEALQRRADRAKEVRTHIVAAAGALAAIAEEIALVTQDRVARHPSGPPASQQPGQVSSGHAARSARRAAGPPDEPWAAGITPAVLWRMVDALADGVVLVDGEGVLVLASRRAEELFGYAHGELTGQRIESLVPARLRSAHQSQRAGYAEQPSARPMGARARLAGLRKDGTTVPVRISLSPVQTAMGRLTMAVVRDISEDQLPADLAELARAAAADDARASRDLLDRVVHGLFGVGLSLQPAADLPDEKAVPQIADALQRVDDIIAEIRNYALGPGGGQPGGAPPNGTR